MQCSSTGDCDTKVGRIKEKHRKEKYFIKNILICVLKMNEGLTGWERHECE